MKRRAFLSSIIAALVAACSRDETAQPSSSTPSSSTPSSSNEPSTTVPGVADVTTSVPETTTTAASMDPIVAPPIELPGGAFGLGVASGDPDANSVVIWTRLDGPVPDSVPIVWEVATDADFERIVATDVVAATTATGHAVHVVVGGLEAFQGYWYRFRAGSLTSATGKTRVMLAPGSIEAVRLAVSSCQDVDRGAYAAHADLAASHPTFVIWLGDYIYRKGTSLADFRKTYADYHRNPLLQASHAACPWIVIPDDNEIANDYDASVDPTVRAAAYRAWWENQPTRLPEPTADAPNVTFYRTLDIGTTARLILTDSRQYANGTTLFGDAQLDFIASAADHNLDRTILCSSVLVSGIRGTDEVLLPYTLDNYPAERARLAEILAGAPSPLIFSGDLHAGMALDFSADPNDPASPIVATELMAPAISSTFPDEYAPFAPFLPLLNPHVKHIDVSNGWLLVEFNPAGAFAEYRTVADVSDPSSAVSPTFRLDLA